MPGVPVRASSLAGWPRLPVQARQVPRLQDVKQQVTIRRNLNRLAEWTDDPAHLIACTGPNSGIEVAEQRDRTLFEVQRRRVVQCAVCFLSLCLSNTRLRHVSRAHVHVLLAPGPIDTDPKLVCKGWF